MILFSRGLWTFSAFSAALLLPAAEAMAQATGGTLGDVLTITTFSFSDMPILTSMFAYVAGCFLAIASIFKFKDHVDNPAQHPISAGVKRFLAAGMMLCLPFMASVASGSIFGDGAAHATGTGVLGPALGDAGSLDELVVNFMTDVAGPMQTLLSAFVYIFAGMFLVLGISRLTKRMDEGPRGPAGMGTIMTFVTAGVFFAMGDMIGAFTTSLFGDERVSTIASINAAIGVSADDAAQIQQVIQGVMLFITIVGMIAFIRGWFVLRAFADGQQGATVAQGLTFLFGGALAINLGDLINALQNSLGIEGITFS